MKTVRKKVLSIHCLLIMLLALLMTSSVFAVDEEECKKLIDKNITASEFPEAPWIILFDRATSRFKETGANETLMEYLVLIQQEEAAQNFSTLRFGFNERSSMIYIDEVVIFRHHDKAVERVPLDSVKTLPAPDDGGLILWNFEMHLVPVGKLEVNDALYYRIRRRGLNIAYLCSDESTEREYLPPMPDHFFDVVYFEAMAPMLERSYRAYAPKEKPLQFAVVNGEVTPSVRFLEDSIEYRWEKRHVPAWQEEVGGPSFTNSAVKLAMATNPDWEGKSRWAYEVNEPQFIISEEMQAMVDSLTRGLTNDLDRMGVLLHWVAENIRYLGLDMGEGEGFTVHKTDDIFRDRAGVCKDKAAVLVSMLRAAGYKAYFVLTLAMEQAVDIPADQFNHGVVAVLMNDGSFVYLDPTWAPKNRALFNAEEQEQPILIATEEGQDLKHIPYSGPEENYWHITANTVFDTAQHIRSSLISIGDGFSGSRMRQSIASRAPQDRISYAFSVLKPISNHIRIETFSHGDPLDFSRPMTVRIDFSLPDYGEAVDDMVYFVPPLSTFPFARPWDNDFLYLADSEKRTEILEILSPRHIIFHETITLPKGYRLREVPGPKSIDGPAASFSWKVEGTGRHIVMQMEILMKKRVIPPDEYDNFKQVVQSIKEAGKTMLCLERASRRGGAK